MNQASKTESQTWSVSEVNRLVKQILESQFLPMWVAGEISNFTRHSSGHLYFSLKDEKSQLKCVMFRSAAARLQFQPSHGMQVTAYGSLGVFEAQGSYQLYVEAIRPAGLGALHQAFEALKKKLNEEGLFDAARKKALPRFPKKIGIITSPTGAAIRDIVNVISRRYPLVKLLLYPAKVQGPGSAGEISSGIKYFNSMQSESRPDLLIAGRGGGSLEDLWAFNEEIVARAIANSEIPIVSAVGHEIDFTIADFVADIRAPTPSAAAELSVPDINEIQIRLINCKDQLSRKLAYKLNYYKELLKRFSGSSLFHPEKLIREYQMKIDAVQNKLESSVQGSLRQTKLHLASLRSQIILKGPAVSVERHRAMMRNSEHRMRRALENAMAMRKAELGVFKKSLLRVRLDAFKSKLVILQTRIAQMDHRKVLDRGYSICRNTQGEIITSYQDVTEKQKIAVELKDGHLECQVQGRRFI